MWTSAAPPILLSPESALGWEFRSRFLRQLPTTLLALCLFPLLCGLFQQMQMYQTWRMSGDWVAPPAMPPFVHLTVVLITLAGVPLVLLSMAPANRHWLLPLETRRLTSIRWMLGAAAAALQTALVSLVARVVTQSDWPVFEPVAWSVVAWAATHLIAVKFRGREWSLGAAGGVAATAIVLLVRSHWQTFDPEVVPAEAFAPMTARHLATLAAVVATLRHLTLRAAEFDRCRWSPLKGASVAAEESVPRRSLRPFRSPGAALLSWEWRRNGRLYVLTAALATFFIWALLVGAAAREFTNRHGQFPLTINWLELTSFGLGTIALGPFVLIVTSTVGRRVMSGKGTDRWPLTLPLSNRRLGYMAVARAILSVTVAGLLSLAISAAVQVGVYLCLRLGGHPEAAETFLQALVPPSGNFRRDIPPAVFVLVTGWTLCGVLESAILTGRRAIAGLPHLLVVGLWFLLIGRAILMPRTEFSSTIPAALIFVFAGAMFRTAWRTGELDWRGGLACLALWIGAALVIDYAHFQSRYSLTNMSPPWILFAWGDTSLALVLACAGTTLLVTLPPLAVRWNRSR